MVTPRDLGSARQKTPRSKANGQGRTKVLVQLANSHVFDMNIPLYYHIIADLCKSGTLVSLYDWSLLTQPGMNSIFAVEVGQHPTGELID